MKDLWWKDSIVYQIYTRSFKDSNGDGIGDLQGIISKLDYLMDLGVNVIWLSPVYISPNADNGYDISDFQEIMDDFGTMEDWEQLLKEVHHRKMKLIMDLVIHHTSDEHPWFIESRKSKDNPYRDYYIWREGEDGKEPNNGESVFGGSRWQHDNNTDAYYFHLFSKKQPDLNWENRQVQEEICKIMKWWIERGIDVFRVDAAPHIKKGQGFPDMPNRGKPRSLLPFPHVVNVEGLHDFLAVLNQNVFQKHNIFTAAEAYWISPEAALPYIDIKKGHFNVVFHNGHMTLDLIELKRRLSNRQKSLQDRVWNSLYLENHDQPRIMSRFGCKADYHRQSAQMLAAFYMFMQGTPFIYQGQEIGMTNVHLESIEDYSDSAMEVIRRTGRDNARTPMQWDDSDNAGFSSNEPWLKPNPNYVSVNVRQQLQDKDSIYHFYKKVIALRKQHSIFRDGEYGIILEDHEEIYAYTRTSMMEAVLVICNFNDGNPYFRFPEALAETERVLHLHNYPVDIREDAAHFQLRPYEVRVYLFKSKCERPKRLG